MLSAIVTAMLGLFWLGSLGLLDLSRLDVPETVPWPQLSPAGASSAAWLCPRRPLPRHPPAWQASGRTDGPSVVGGPFTGVLLTGSLLAPLQRFPGFLCRRNREP